MQNISKKQGNNVKSISENNTISQFCMKNNKFKSSAPIKDKKLNSILMNNSLLTPEANIFNLDKRRSPNLSYNKKSAKIFVCKKELIRVASPIRKERKAELKTEKDKEMFTHLFDKHIFNASKTKKKSSRRNTNQPGYDEYVREVPRSNIFINTTKQKNRKKQTGYSKYADNSQQQFNDKTTGTDYLFSQLNYEFDSMLNRTEKLERLHNEAIETADASTNYDNIESYLNNSNSSTSQLQSSNNSNYCLNMEENNFLNSDYIEKIIKKHKKESVVTIRRENEKILRRKSLNNYAIAKRKKIPKNFFMVTKLASTHFNDTTFSEISRGKQGLPMCVMAYLYSYMKSPNRWDSYMIDTVLIMGDKLYLKSLNILQLNECPREFAPEELTNIVEIDNIQIKYKIDEPCIAGYTRSGDKRKYNLLQGLTIFFSKHYAGAGILHTHQTTVLILKQKYFYIFDPKARNNDLYYTEDGYSSLTTVYNIPAVAAVILDRGKLDNHPFIIYNIDLVRVLTEEELAKGDTLNYSFNTDSFYTVLNPKKAIIKGYISLTDNCFKETNGKQILSNCLICLIFNEITSSKNWHRKIIDKILIVGNNFYKECVKISNETSIAIEKIPNSFQIGPLDIQINISINQYTGTIFRNNKCCLSELIYKFFEESYFYGIAQLDNYIIPFWRNESYYYYFDNYNRTTETLSGNFNSASVLMFPSVEYFMESILESIDNKNLNFKIHTLQSVMVSQNISDDNPAINVSNLDAINSKITILSDADNQLAVPMFINGTIPSEYRQFLPLEAIPSETETDLETIPYSEFNASDFKDLLMDTLTDDFEKEFMENIFDKEEEVDTFLVMTSENYKNEDYFSKYFREYSNINCSNSTSDIQAASIFSAYSLEPFSRTNFEYLNSLSHYKAKNTINSIPNESNTTALPKDHYKNLADGSQALYGTTNITKLSKCYENACPFASAIAVVLAKKYQLENWNDIIVDAVLTYGIQIYENINLKYDSVPKIVLPRLYIGSTCYSIIIDYLFDSLLSQTILEQSLEKLVFRTRDAAIIVTKVYSCAVIFHKYYYYFFDSFGTTNTESGENLACMLRFKTLENLVNHFIFHKNQRDNSEHLEATRFIISTIDVKTLSPVVVENIQKNDKLMMKSKKKVAVPKEAKKKPASTKKPDSKLKIKKKVLKKTSNLIMKNIQNIKNMKTIKNVKNIKNSKPTKSLKTKKKNTFKRTLNCGYQKKDQFFLIEGTTGLTEKDTDDNKFKTCHFVGICAILGIFSKPLLYWDPNRVDYVVTLGKDLFNNIDNAHFVSSRLINNLFIDKFLFDIQVRKLLIPEDQKVKTLKNCLKYWLSKKKFFLLQFSCCCYVLYQSPKKMHLFDPYGITPNHFACWIQFQNDLRLIRYLTFNHKKDLEHFSFYTLNIKNVRKVTKKNEHTNDYKVKVSCKKGKKKPKIQQCQIFNENEDWLLVRPIPWSRTKKTAACGKSRGDKLVRWNNWDIEYTNDLYSLTSTKHQAGLKFSKTSRNKQTIANCILAIAMIQKEPLASWNESTMDSILINGDKFFIDTIANIKQENHELKIEDFATSLTVPPHTMQVNVKPEFGGIMFIYHPETFNLARAVRFFLESHDKRYGIISCSLATRTKYISFGKLNQSEYFMFDSSSIGKPMFDTRTSSKAFILRCTTINRLIHVMTVTLKSGNFFIYSVDTSDKPAENEIPVPIKSTNNLSKTSYRQNYPKKCLSATNLS